MGQDPQPIRAAGGVITRRSATGEREILVAHRPRYDDWSFPKGKAAPGESDEDCALREVEEETGLRCELEAELESVSYLDRRGRRKLVRYWLMRPLEGEFEPGDEVDELRWLSPAAAAANLSYEHDRALVRRLADST